ncbi:4-coumarate--CoA ligase [Caulobacter mirabilis]|uniref:4-coumarate--CoA ligase n=2 Tax=Caulobacter mirabilis TaxID=69666 RepID=A0A2D2B3T0_9CAUL|nr:4-coumarate--CoA ligase [Caulobacter mirabilis]
MTIADMIAADFGTVPDLIRIHAADRPTHRALVQGDQSISYAELDALMDRVAAGLQRDGVKPGQALSVCAATSIEYAALFLGGLRAGAAVAPIAPSSTPDQIVAMVNDSGASLFFLDAAVAAEMGEALGKVVTKQVSLDGSDAGLPFLKWLPEAGAEPQPVELDRKAPFNIIYSSGTTGTPKGIVQSHGMRWRHLAPRPDGVGYGPDAVGFISTPLYSNTTLVCFFPTLAGGGTMVMIPKFDTVKWLETAQRERVTHAMLVPVQYRRLLEHPDFDRYDLSSFQMKFCTSAPFAAELKKQALERWPGGLIEYYGMTEGGGGFMLLAHLHPDKLHTVGQPSPGAIIKLIDEDGNEVGPNEVGEIVGRSAATMSGYHNQPKKTAEAQWTDPATGDVYIRTGDVGKLDEDGFLTLMDRRKDMIITGGFNVYPSDLEAVLVQHDAVAEAAVIAAPSDQWGETPVAFVALKDGAEAAPDALKAFVNGQVGKTQRLADVVLVDILPRSHIGKVLKRELRDDYVAMGRKV